MSGYNRIMRNLNKSAMWRFDETRLELDLLAIQRQFASTEAAFQNQDHADSEDSMDDTTPYRPPVVVIPKLPGCLVCHVCNEKSCNGWHPPQDCLLLKCRTL